MVKLWAQLNMVTIWVFFFFLISKLQYGISSCGSAWIVGFNLFLTKSNICSPTRQLISITTQKKKEEIMSIMSEIAKKEKKKKKK